MGAAHQVALLDEEPTDWRTLTTANATRLLD